MDMVDIRVDMVDMVAVMVDMEVDMEDTVDTADTEDTGATVDTADMEDITTGDMVVGFKTTYYTYNAFDVISMIANSFNQQKTYY